MQGIMIVSILTAVGIAIEVLIETLLGGTTVYSTKSGNTSGGDKKGGGASRKQIESFITIIR